MLKESNNVSRKHPTSRFASLSAFFFVRWKLSLVLWGFLLGFGILTYTSLIKREGFPPIQFPVTIVNGSYNSNDKNIVDTELAQPFYEIVRSIEGVRSIQTTTFPQQFTAVVFFDSDVVPVEGSYKIQTAVGSSELIDEATRDNLVISTINPASYLNRFDLLLSVYSTTDSTEDELEEVAEFVARDFESDPRINEAAVVPLQSVIAGTDQKVVTNFNRIGLPDSEGTIQFYKAVTVGIDRDNTKVDVIELSRLTTTRIEGLDIAQFGDEYQVVIGADFAKTINTQISSLESNLFSGLLAVALVSFLLITWRASIITGLFMFTVMVTTVALLYLFGYTLNTITLFGLVLSLGLFVDDATIVVESIDAHRHRKKKSLDIVKQAVTKIGSASFAGTFTTVLVFLPLAFLSGILGEFIRLMPVTVIIALTSSLVLSLTLIPVLSKFILLRKDSKDNLTKLNPIVRAEAFLGHKIGNVPRLIISAPLKGRIVAISMLFLTFASIAVAFQYASKVDFNIFPPSKDTNQVGYNSTYPPGYTVEEAENVAAQVDRIVADELETLISRITYGSFSFSQPNNRSSDALIELIPYTDRDRKSPEIVETLQALIDSGVPDGVVVTVQQFDAGPPVSDFPFAVQIIEEDEERALDLAGRISAHIEGAEVVRPNGTTARITATLDPSTQSVKRVDGRRQVEVRAAFNADDTSALLAAAQQLVEEQFTSEYLESIGYSKEAISFDFGQESENAESFAALAYAFPIALLLMYVLLASQFRSFLQPILIFMAIPFTFLGVFAGLYYTDNALSFFVQVGLIGLIGIAVNNTILLTTYANQEKRDGVRTIDAIANAITKRFRPLIATTLTTVVALLPLALTDPFWEPLAFTIIFGLLSSTFFVLLAFPYYFLAFEWLRMRVSRGTRVARRKHL